MVTINKLFTLTGHKDAIYALESGTQSHTIYSCGGDGHVLEWNLQNPEKARLIAKVDASVYSMRLIRDENVLIVGHNFDGIHLMDLTNGKEAGSLKLGKKAIFDIQLRKNFIFVATGEGSVIVIDRPSLTIVKSISLTDQNIRTILFDQDDNLIVGASDGGIRKISFGDFIITQQIKAHENSVFILRQCPNSKYFLSGGRDARLKFWKNEEEISLDEEIVAHMYAINDISFHPNGKYFATASMDKTIKIWDYAERKLLKVIDKARHQGHLTSVNKLLWTDFNDILVSCSDDRSIGAWDVNIEK